MALGFKRIWFWGLVRVFSVLRLWNDSTRSIQRNGECGCRNKRLFSWITHTGGCGRLSCGNNDDHSVGTVATANGVGLIVVLALSVLMISNVKFRTFKRAKMSLLLLVGFLSIAIAVTYVALAFDPALAIVGLMGAYVTSGLLEYMIRWLIRDKGEADEVLADGVEVEYAHEIEKQYASLYEEHEEELID